MIRWKIVKKKRKEGYMQSLLVVVFLFGIFWYAGGFFEANDNNQEVLGSNSNGNHDNDGDKPGNGNYQGSTTTIQPTASTTIVLMTASPTITLTTTQAPTLTATPTVDAAGSMDQFVTPTTQISVANTPQPTITQKQESSPIQTSTGYDSSSYKTEKVVEMVSISENSVTTNSVYVAPVVTQSVFRVIKNKIEQVGKGEFLSKPTPESTPIPKMPTASQEGESLPSDANVFYKLTGEGVLLGAENSSGRQLAIKDGDLRSAEITLNKVLSKKNLVLSLTADNNFALVDGAVIALTEMPIHVNIDSQKMFLSTPEGKKELKILPEQAVKDAVELKTFEKLNSDSVPSIVVLGEELAYKVVGDKTYKAFGFLRLSVKQNVYITAESGEIVEGEQPFFTRFVRLISI